jgi:hypothetical protein
MRNILCAAIAAAAICGMSISLAVADPDHVPGGPVQEGNMCWVSTQSDNGYGYWKECAPTVKPMHHKKGS